MVKDETGLKKSLAHTVMLTLLSAAVLTMIGTVFAKPLLGFLQTPTEIIEQSYSYVRIVLSCLLVSMLYNMFAGMMRGIGNSFMPLVFLIISTVCNAILDVVFVGGIGMGNLCRSCICRLSLINEKNEGAGFGLYYFLGNGRKKNGAI